MRIIETLRNRARAHPQRIVLSDGEDPRAIRAAARVTAAGFARITLLGWGKIIEAIAAEQKIHLAGVQINEHAASPRLDAYAQIYLERRRSRGVTLEEARDASRKP